MSESTNSDQNITRHYYYYKADINEEMKRKKVHFNLEITQIYIISPKQPRRMYQSKRNMKKNLLGNNEKQGVTLTGLSNEDIFVPHNGLFL